MRKSTRALSPRSNTPQSRSCPTNFEKKSSSSSPLSAHFHLENPTLDQYIPEKNGKLRLARNHHPEAPDFPNVTRATTTTCHSPEGWASSARALNPPGAVPFERCAEDAPDDAASQTESGSNGGDFLLCVPEVFLSCVPRSPHPALYKTVWACTS